MEEKFNPENFRSYSELPEQEKENFVEVEGGFVRKEAAQLLQRAEEVAREINRNRSLIEKIFNKGAVNAIDVLHESALFEFRSKINELYEGVTSIHLWESLSKEEFESMIKNAFEEARREDPNLTEDQALKYFKDKARRFAQWLEDTKYRPFFLGSERKIELVIDKIRSLAE